MERAGRSYEEISYERFFGVVDRSSVKPDASD
jgi:hypothetical protein